MDEGWGQLVSLTDIETLPFMINTDKFTIGRAADCDLCLGGNKMVSAHHCFISRDEDGKVWLHDNSTNGTLLNMLYKVSKGNKKQLEHGDEFYVVFKKNNEELNVGYIYQDMAKLQEEESTQEYSPVNLLEATLADEDINQVESSPESRKRKLDSPDVHEEEDSQRKKSRPNSPEPSTAPSVGQDIKQREDDSTKQETDTKVQQTDSKTEKVKDTNTEVKDTIPEVVKDKDTKEMKDTGKKTECKSEEPARDDIEENLLCIICQEIMHDCISLQPCLHSFCAGCYSDWMPRSPECPSCRMKVDRINKNHIVNNLIEAYLKVNPGKRRSEEDLKELNAKNKVTKDMLYPKAKPGGKMYEYGDDSGSSEYSDSDDYESPPPPVHIALPPQPIIAPTGGTLFGFGTPFFGAIRPPRTICRQCPDYKDPKDNTGIVGGIKTVITTVKNMVTGGDTTAGTAGGEAGNQSTDNTDGEPVGEAGPSTLGGNADGDGAGPGGVTALGYKTDLKIMPDPVPFVCGVNQDHVLCQCCLQPMPDVRVQTNDPTQPNYRPLQCCICYRAFCHAYWGCRKLDCTGCLNKFKEMNFGRKCLNSLIMDNVSESAIFRDYIDMKKMSVKDVLQECVRKMDAGEFTCPDQVRNTFNSNVGVCYPCGLRNFKALALQYRKTIPKNQLPEHAKKRPDCYWGENCRTQKNKPQHGANFNHICDQIRF